MEELDFLKFVFITLMIAFHLTYIGDTYPVAKKLVYTFHMPGFLLVSGYLFNVNKSWAALGKTMLWIFIPLRCDGKWLYRNGFATPYP